MVSCILPPQKNPSTLQEGETGTLGAQKAHVASFPSTALSASGTGSHGDPRGQGPCTLSQPAGSPSRKQKTSPGTEILQGGE